MTQDTTVRKVFVRGAARLRFAVYGRDGLSVLRNEWQKLTQRLVRPGFWHLHAWYDCYAEAFTDQPLTFIAAYCDDRLAGILPLVCEQNRLHGIRADTLALPTHPHLPFSDVVVDARLVPRGFFSQLIEFTAQAGLAWDALLLTHAPSTSYALRLLERDEVRRVIKPSKRYNCVLARDYETLSGQMSPKVRENLRRARRRLRDLGAGYQVASDQAALARAFVEFLNVEASGWKGATGTGTAIKLDPRLIAFYQALMARFGEQGMCEIHMTASQDKVLAAQFCLCVGETIYPLKIGYDEAYARWSPGKVLMDDTVRGALAQGREINVLSAAPWALEWHPQVRTAFGITVFNGTVRGRAAYAASRLHGFSRAVYHRTVRPLLHQYAARRAAWPKGVTGPKV